MRVPTVVRYNYRILLAMVLLWALLAWAIHVALSVRLELSVFFVLVCICGYRILARLVFDRHHAQGIRSLKKERYADSVASFHKAVDFWTRHPAIDRYRFLVMQSPTLQSRREICSCGLATALVLARHLDEAQVVCENMLEMNPGNQFAMDALRLMSEAREAASPSSEVGDDADKGE